MCVCVCVCLCAFVCIHTGACVSVRASVCMYKVCVCLTLKGRMQIADEYAAAPYREMIA